MRMHNDAGHSPEVRSGTVGNGHATPNIGHRRSAHPDQNGAAGLPLASKDTGSYGPRFG